MRSDFFLTEVMRVGWRNTKGRDGKFTERDVRANIHIHLSSEQDRWGRGHFVLLYMYPYERLQQQLLPLLDFRSLENLSYY